jgi:hypothetical protein
MSIAASRVASTSLGMTRFRWTLTAVFDTFLNLPHAVRFDSGDMVKHFETIQSWFYICGFGILCGAAGYVFRRNAAKFGRQSAEATVDTPRMLRWLNHPKYTEAEWVSRYRSLGLAHMILGGLCFVAGVVMIIVTASRMLVVQ